METISITWKVLSNSAVLDRELLSVKYCVSFVSVSLPGTVIHVAGAQY